MLASGSGNVLKIVFIKQRIRNMFRRNRSRNTVVKRYYPDNKSPTGEKAYWHAWHNNQRHPDKFATKEGADKRLAQLESQRHETAPNRPGWHRSQFVGT
jgi:hypothetical protein